LCLVSAAAHAETAVREAEFAIETCDTARGLARLEALAERGDAAAQWKLGELFLATDRGVAERWFRRAFETRKRLAEQGDIEALESIVQAFRWGSGTAIDEQAALEWERRAARVRVEKAEAGDVEAQYLLAEHYAKLVGSNHALRHDAQYWWTRVFPAIKEAAESGDLRAQERLADMYRYGDGVAENKAEAERWNRVVIANLDAAAAKGELGALLRLDKLSRQGKPGWTGTRPAGNDVEARYRAAAVQGCVPAQFMVALRLEERVYPRNPDARHARLQAAMWWMIAARSTEPRHAILVRQARDFLVASKLDLGEEALVRAKAARCLDSNYGDCD
jgi:TPR repeat protein